MQYTNQTATGSNNRSRSFKRQVTEAHIKCLVINKMTKLGMPIGKWKEVA